MTTEVVGTNSWATFMMYSPISASALALEPLFKLFLTPIHVRSEVKLCCRDYFCNQWSNWKCNMTIWRHGPIFFVKSDFQQSFCRGRHCQRPIRGCQTFFHYHYHYENFFTSPLYIENLVSQTYLRDDITIFVPEIVFIMIMRNSLTTPLACSLWNQYLSRSKAFY